MAELLSRLSGGELIGLVAVLGAFVVGAISAVAKNWRRVRVAEVEANLKQQMLGKGMTAAEIEQVLRASGDRWPDAPPAFTGNEAADKVALVKVMSDNGLSGEDIERVLRAFQERPDGSREKGELVQNLVDNETPAEEIARILRAFQGPREEGPAPGRERITTGKL